MSVIGRETLKRLALRAGSRCPRGAVQTATKLAGWLEIGRWMRTHCTKAPRHLDSREDIFDLIGREVAWRRVLYLEFGVYEGVSIKYWSRLLKEQNSILHGFDSFEGLPEPWSEDHPKGRFSTSEGIPEIDDGRVKFFKGWFEDTLPEYVVPTPYDVVVINIDADLYSSARCVLRHVRKHMPVGTWLYFDEFSNAQHEFRAFREFVEETGMQFEVVAESNALWNVAFRRID